MPTLHMDVETVRTMQAQMIQQKDAMVEQLTALATRINQTVGAAWIGNAANEFQQQVEQKRISLINQMDALDTLASNLQREITQWVEMASRLG
jgi:uncharacterized protein YukE